jgi:hypothetical protein
MVEEPLRVFFNFPWLLWFLIRESECGDSETNYVNCHVFANSLWLVLFSLMAVIWSFPSSFPIRYPLILKNRRHTGKFKKLLAAPLLTHTYPIFLLLQVSILCDSSLEFWKFMMCLYFSFQYYEVPYSLPSDFLTSGGQMLCYANR